MAMTGKLWAMMSTMEVDRQDRTYKAKMWVFLIMLIALVADRFLYPKGGVGPLLGMLFTGLVFSGVLYGYLMKKVARDFKKQILPVLVQDIEPSLSYIVDSGIDIDEFNEPGLFQNPDRYTGKDLIVGSVGQTEVKFSLVHAEEKRSGRTTDSDGRTTSETKYATIFSGLFFIADFNKRFVGRTLVKPDRFNLFNQLFGSLVILEDSAFNNMFTVNSTDQLEARYILTPSLMEKFKTLYTKVGSFQACFIHGRLFMAIEMPQDFFEPTLTRSLADSQQLKKISDHLRLITGIVEDLGLNVRNWGAKTGT